MSKFSSLYAIPSKNGLTKPRTIRGEGIKFINMGELFQSHRIGDIQTERVPVTEKELREALLQEGDLLFARQSLVREGAGKCSVVTEVSEPTTYDSHLIRVRLDRKVANPYFFQYYFSSALSPIPGIVSQCAQAGIKGTDLGNLDVFCPNLDLQNRIVDVLEAYDKLIENSRRQIALLEEAVQRLYKEWFVDLRFPGYEATPIIDRLPEGWRKGKLDEIVEFRRGKTITQNETLDGDVPVVAGGLKPAYYHAHANTTSPVITVSGSGANAGFCRLYTTEIWASDCSFADSSMTDNLYFAYASIKVLSNGFKQCQRGSAQPHVYPKHVNALDVVIPDGACLSAFNDAAKALYSQIGILNERVSAAREARDRLLPKLMSGEIEVG